MESAAQTALARLGKGLQQPEDCLLGVSLSTLFSGQQHDLTASLAAAWHSLIQMAEPLTRSTNPCVSRRTLGPIFMCENAKPNISSPHDDLVFVLAHLRPSASIAESHTHTEYRVTPPLTLSGEDLVEVIAEDDEISYVSWAP